MAGVERATGTVAVIFHCTSCKDELACLVIPVSALADGMLDVGDFDLITARLVWAARTTCRAQMTGGRCSGCGEAAGADAYVVYGFGSSDV